MQRIISLVPSQTELLFDLELENQIVGITKFCIHPKELCKHKTKIGGTKKFDFEKIDVLKPDLIIGNKEENYKDGIETLTQKYPTWISDIFTLEDALIMIEKIGELTNTSTKALNIIQQIKEQFYTLNPAWEKPPKVAYLIWFEPIMAVGHQTFIQDMLEKIGFENVFAHQLRYPSVTLEDLYLLAPDYLFLSSEPFPFREKHLNFFKKHLPNTKILIVDGEMFSWYGTRLLKSVTYFKELIKTLSQ